MLKFHPFEKYLAPNKKDYPEKTFRTASLFPFDKFANHFFLVIIYFFQGRFANLPPPAYTYFSQITSD